MAKLTSDRNKNGAHFARLAEKATEKAGQTWLKLFNDACDAKCGKEFRRQIRELGLDDEAKHFLGAALMRILT